MLVHRFRELLETFESIPAAMAVRQIAAFVPFPIAFSMPPVQQAQVEYLYRIAFEQAQAQVARAGGQRWLGYSLN
jgi:hypothetical protein